MIKIKKGNQTLEVTEKAFRVVYESVGYTKAKPTRSTKKAGDNE